MPDPTPGFPSPLSMQLNAAWNRDPITKAIRLLQVMVDNPTNSMGVREVASAAKLPPATAHRLLANLQSSGLVDQDLADNRYRLGLEFFRLAWRAADRNILSDVARPLLTQLVERCNETAFLGLYEPRRRQMFFALAIEPTHPLRYVVSLNEWLPIDAGASGLAVLANLPDEEVDEILEGSETAMGTGGSHTPDLRSELTLARERGYACTHGQRAPGAAGVAAPIWDSNHRVLGDVCLAVPDERFPSARELELGSLVSCAAAELTKQIGGSPPLAGRRS